MLSRKYRNALLVVLITCISLVSGCIPVPSDPQGAPSRPDDEMSSNQIDPGTSANDTPESDDRDTLISDSSPLLTADDVKEDNIGELFVVSGELLSISRAKSGNILIEVQTEDGVVPVYIKESTGINGLQFTPGVSFQFRGPLSQYDGMFEIVPSSEEDILRKSEYAFEEILILEVIDGDTVWAQMSDGSEEKIRFIGVDAPETEKPGQPGEPLADEATDYTEEMVLDRNVYLEMDNDDRDKYGRLLGYLWLEIPEEITKESVRAGNISALLLAQGLAEPIAVGDNDKYYDLFLDVALDAAA